MVGSSILKFLGLSKNPVEKAIKQVEAKSQAKKTATPAQIAVSEDITNNINKAISDFMIAAIPVYGTENPQKIENVANGLRRRIKKIILEFYKRRKELDSDKKTAKRAITLGVIEYTKSHVAQDGFTMNSKMVGELGRIRYELQRYMEFVKKRK